MAAYYCFVNFGWSPSQFDNLPRREKLMVIGFALRDLKNRKEAHDAAKGAKGR